jgi:hypothetical protein
MALWIWIVAGVVTVWLTFMAFALRLLGIRNQEQEQFERPYLDEQKDP